MFVGSANASSGIRKNGLSLKRGTENRGIGELENRKIGMGNGERGTGNGERGTGNL